MAIQVRRGTNAEWENTNQNIVAGEPAVALDSERFFVGTGAGTYAEYVNVKSIAPAYSTTRAYREGDYVMYNGKLYVCTTATTGGAWNAANWEESSILEALTGDAPYRGYETASVSGNVVSFNNGAGGIPVKDLEVEVSATQNLNGYDAPWVGGAGVNQWDEEWVLGTLNTSNGSAVSVSNRIRSKNYISVLPNTTYYIHAPYQLIVCQYNSSQGFIKTSWVNNGTLTTESNTAYIRIASNAEATTYNHDISINYPSTVTTYSPYTNICPISGWDEVNVTRTGKNLFGLKLEDYADAISYGLSSYKSISVPNGVYTISTNAPTGYIWGGDKIDSGVSYTRVYSGNPHTVTVENGLIYIGILTTDKATALSYNIQIERGSTATAYEPYNGQTYTTDLDGTRYGGTLDVTTGVLTIDKAKVDLDSLNWGYETTSNRNFFYYNIGSTAKSNGTFICSAYKFGGEKADAQMASVETGVYAHARYIYIKDTQYTDVTTFKNSLTGQQLVYELATPQTVQLTPTEVRTLLKENNIWADSGKIINCTYRITNT